MVEKKKKSLVLISGGLDSVAALVWMLENTDDIIHAHHINLKNYENRNISEAMALAKIGEYCKKHYRSFKYTESRMDLPGFTPYDVYVYMWYAGILSMSYTGKKKLDRVVTGTIKRVNPKDGRNQKAERIFQATADRDDIEWFMPVENMTKKQIWDSIPLKLAEFTWSCRRPTRRNGRRAPCGKCPTCKELVGIRG